MTPKRHRRLTPDDGDAAHILALLGGIESQWDAVEEGLRAASEVLLALVDCRLASALEAGESLTRLEAIEEVVANLNDLGRRYPGATFEELAERASDEDEV